MPSFTKDQQSAIDTQGMNILVSAGAGSGKTAVLSQRVLRKLLENVSIDNLLVLTFTNAAAKEMKGRIRQKVSEVDSLKDELDKIASSYITTFDSFALSVVKKYHYLMNLDKNITVCDDSILKLKIRKTLDEMFNEYYEEENEYYLDLIRTYCAKNDKDIQEFIISLYEKIDLLNDKEIYISNYISTYFSDEHINNLVGEFNDLIYSHVEQLNEAYQNIEILNKDYALKFDRDISKVKTLDDVMNINPETKIPRMPSKSSEELKAEKEIYKKNLENILKYQKFGTISTIKNEYISTKKNTTVILDIIKELDKRISEYKTKNSLYNFLDIAKLSIKILKDNEEVRKYYKNRFNEILVDEYQDTSDIQEEFISLIANNNVYMVGDIKQSIYKFRNANPNIFKEKFDNYGQNIGGKRIDLNKNFRSRSEVLSSINILFDLLMDDKIGGAKYKEEHQMVFGNTDYSTKGDNHENNNIELINYESCEEKKYKDSEIEFFIMVNDIKTKLQNNYQVYDKKNGVLRKALYSDFAILIDSGKHFSTIKKIFDSVNIPLSVYQDVSIKESVIVQIIKNLFILVSKTNKNQFNREYKYALTSILRSFICKTDDDLIHTAITTNDYSKIPLLNIIEDLAANMDEKNIFDLTKEIIEKLNIIDKLSLIGDVEANTLVLEYITSFANSNANLYSLEEFIAFLDNVTKGDIEIKYKLQIEETNAVKIMSIHASKGLEYPIVYLPLLDNKFNRMDIQSKYIFDNKYGIILPSNIEELKTSFVKELNTHEYKISDVGERLRLFYVALTRAEEKVIVIMNYKNNKDYKIKNGVINNLTRINYLSFAKVLESLNSLMPNYITTVDINTLNLNKNYKTLSGINYKTAIKKSNQKYSVNTYHFDDSIIENKKFSKESINLVTSKEKNNMALGLKLHSILENIDFDKPDYSSIENEYKDIIKNFFKQDILNNRVNVYKEYEFMYQDENINHGIIDLLIEKENEYIIIDYKLNNITSKEYIKQLNGYKVYIEGLTNKKTSIYLYSLLKEELIEVPPLKEVVVQ